MAQLKRDHPELALTATDEARALGFFGGDLLLNTQLQSGQWQKVFEGSVKGLVHESYFTHPFGAHTYTQNLPFSNPRIHSWFQKRKDDIGVGIVSQIGPVERHLTMPQINWCLSSRSMIFSYSPQRIKTSKKACFIENCKLVK